MPPAASSIKPNYDKLIKILLIGDSNAGKSSLLMRFADDTFVESYIATIGIDFKIKTLNIDGKRVRLQLWDSCGSIRFRTITNSYYRGATSIIMVYDTTDAESFGNIHHWLTNIDIHANADTIRVLVGNKCDLTSEKAVTTLQGQELADKFHMKFYETSAKLDINVTTMFLELARDSLEVQSNPSTSANGAVSLVNDTSTARSSCCS